MEQTNFIGLVYSTLEEAGIDTSNLSLEEAIAKYNELAGDDVTVEDVEEQVEEAVQEVAQEDTQIEEVVEEDTFDDTLASADEISDEEFAEVVSMYKAEILAFLQENNYI